MVEWRFVYNFEGKISFMCYVIDIRKSWFCYSLSNGPVWRMTFADVLCLLRVKVKSICLVCVSSKVQEKHEKPSCVNASKWSDSIMTTWQANGIIPWLIRRQSQMWDKAQIKSYNRHIWIPSSSQWRQFRDNTMLLGKSFTMYTYYVSQYGHCIYILW